VNGDASPTAAANPDAAAAAPHADNAAAADAAADAGPGAATADNNAPPDGGAAVANGGDNDKNPPDCSLPDKDIAREAWRRNWPTVCATSDGDKAFMIIPIKGSLDKENHELRRKPTREARVNLPNAESLLTMKQYKVKKLGFKELRLGSGDDGGTRVRLKLLPAAGDPVFDVKDGYVKVTVAVSGSSSHE